VSVLVVLHDLWFAVRLLLALAIGIGWAALVGAAGGRAARSLDRRGSERAEDDRSTRCP